MLGSVITARDRWLNPGGLILPSSAMCLPCCQAKQCAFEEPCFETIMGENVLTWPHVVSILNCVPHIRVVSCSLLP
ncbi:hypothetical protein CerSpe_070060 [Prunus speciosa]